MLKPKKKASYAPDPEWVAQVLWENLTVRHIVHGSCPPSEFKNEAKLISKEVGRIIASDPLRLVPLDEVAEICYVSFRIQFIGISFLMPKENNKCWLEIAKKILPLENTLK